MRVRRERRRRRSRRRRFIIISRLFFLIAPLANGEADACRHDALDYYISL